MYVQHFHALQIVKLADFEKKCQTPTSTLIIYI